MRGAKKRGLRDNFGTLLIEHRGKQIFTTVGSRKYESQFGGLQPTSSKLGVIPSGYAHRPDLISNLFLDTPALWWMVCERNAIFDVFEQLKSGDPIILI